MNNFNIFAQLHKEINEFETEKIHISGSEDSQELSKLKGTAIGYDFSQKDTLNLIELYYNSKFESGQTDSEGQRKVFLNISKFKSDVASKQVDIDVKDFVFVPEDTGSEWGSWFLTRKFRKWARKNYFGKLINEIVNDYPKYGTAVMKEVGNELQRVPLKTLRVKQDAKDLQSSEYVIEEHTDMQLWEMEDYGWDTKGLELEWDSKVDVFERYGRVPLSFYKEYNKMKVDEGDEQKSIDVMAILAPTETDPKNSKYGGAILFLEKIKARPYREVHWSKIDGRWLGVGEIELQFENQVFRNMIVNLRRRGLLWSGKKIFQSTDTEVNKNLVRDVRDGEVLKIMPNGNITQVNTTTQALAEFQAATNDIDENSNQKAFTFEVATGEQMQSGTPFRLGVMLSNAVNAHFNLKRENLGLFFEEVVYELLFPVFKKENKKADTMLIPSDEEGIESLKEALRNLNVWEVFKEKLLKGEMPNVEQIKLDVEKELTGRNFLSFDFSDNFWETLKVSTALVITGESVNLEKRLETMTNLYNTMVQTGDPRAERVLKRILSSAGENLDMLAGIKPQANPMQAMGQAPQAQGQGQMPTPNLAV